MSTSPVLLAACWLSAAPALADPAFDACMKAAATNVDFGECGKALLAREDGRLNAAWKQAAARASAQAAKDLREEQRAWLKFRDASCLIYGNADDFGREGAVIRFPACRDAVILDRIKTLESYRDDMAPK